MLSILDPVSRRGRELCDALIQACPEQAHTYFHTTGTDEHLLTEVAGQARLVRPLVDLEELAGSAAVVMIAPPAPELGTRLASWLERQPALPVVDYSLPPFLPAAEAVVFGGPRDRISGARRLQALDPALAGPAIALDALSPLRLGAAHLTLLTPAADASDEAVEELAAQAVARLSGERPAKPRLLPGLLAFDAGLVSAARHEHLRSQVGQLGLGVAATVTALATSSFHGHLAALTVSLDGARRTAEVEAALRRHPLIQVGRGGRLGMLSAVVGQGEVKCGEIEGGNGSWSLLLAYDGSQLVGPPAVVDVLVRLTAA